MLLPVNSRLCYFFYQVAHHIHEWMGRELQVCFRKDTECLNHNTWGIINEKLANRASQSKNMWQIGEVNALARSNKRPTLSPSLQKYVMVYLSDEGSSCRVAPRCNEVSRYPKIVRYNRVFAIAKSLLQRIIWFATKIFVIAGYHAEPNWTMGYTPCKTVYRLVPEQLHLNEAKLWRSKFPYLDQ